MTAREEVKPKTKRPSVISTVRRRIQEKYSGDPKFSDINIRFHQLVSNRAMEQDNIKQLRHEIKTEEKLTKLPMLKKRLTEHKLKLKEIMKDDKLHHVDLKLKEANKKVKELRLERDRLRKERKVKVVLPNHEPEMLTYEKVHELEKKSRDHIEEATTERCKAFRQSLSDSSVKLSKTTEEFKKFAKQFGLISSDDDYQMMDSKPNSDNDHEDKSNIGNQSEEEEEEEEEDVY